MPANHTNFHRRAYTVFKNFKTARPEIIPDIVLMCHPVTGSPLGRCSLCPNGLEPIQPITDVMCKRLLASVDGSAAQEKGQSTDGHVAPASLAKTIGGRGRDVGKLGRKPKPANGQLVAIQELVMPAGDDAVAGETAIQHLQGFFAYLYKLDPSQYEKIKQ